VKLLMVSNYFETHRGGLDLMAGRLVRELLRLGQDVVWIATEATPPPGDPDLKGRAMPVRALNVTESYLGIPFPIPSLRAICRIRREVGYVDALLLQDSLYPMCVLAFLFARFARKPVVIAQHVGIVRYRNPVFRSLMSLANRVVARPMLSRADRVAFVSEITARYFRELGFSKPATLIFNGVDTNIFRPITPAQKLNFRHRLSLPADRPVVLFVGRFVEKKGLHILARMARLRPHILWAFAGWGRLDPREWRLPNVVVFSDLTGPSLAPLYQASDLLVLPSKGEGFPLVIQEALACGLPVVCSSETVGADAAASAFLSAVALNERNPEATALAFCAQIDSVLSGGAEGHLGPELFRFVSQRYSWPACATQYLDLILSLPAPPRGARPP
jgi:glycosyltransferase involved in cell wall biosynthesis